MSVEVIDFGGDVSYWRKKAQQLEKAWEEAATYANTMQLERNEAREIAERCHKDLTELVIKHKYFLHIPRLPWKKDDAL